MEILQTRDAASIILFDLRISEGEMEVFADALAFLLRHLSAEELYQVFNDEKERAFEDPTQTYEFVNDTYRDLMRLIKEHCRDDFLAARFKEWKGE